MFQKLCKFSRDKNKYLSKIGKSRKYHVFNIFPFIQSSYFWDFANLVNTNFQKLESWWKIIFPTCFHKWKIYISKVCKFSKYHISKIGNSWKCHISTYFHLWKVNISKVCKFGKYHISKIGNLWKYHIFNIFPLLKDDIFKSIGNSWKYDIFTIFPLLEISYFAQW